MNRRKATDAKLEERLLQESPAEANTHLPSITLTDTETSKSVTIFGKRSWPGTDVQIGSLLYLIRSDSNLWDQPIFWTTEMMDSIKVPQIQQAGSIEPTGIDFKKYGEREQQVVRIYIFILFVLEPRHGAPFG